LVPDVPRKFPLPAPLNKLKDSAFDAVKDPRGTSERLIGQARGAASAGRHLAGGLASQVVEQVNTRRRRASDAPRAESRVDTHAAPSPAPRKAQGDPVATHPATDAPSAEPVPTTEARVTAAKATPADVAKKTANKTTAKKAPAKKSAAKKTAAKKTAAKKTAAEKTAAKKAATEAPAEKPAAGEGRADAAPAGRTPETAAGAPGDKLPPRTATTPTPPPPPAEVEPNPEATPPRQTPPR
jgi:hypothetical protein